MRTALPSFPANHSEEGWPVHGVRELLPVHGCAEFAAAELRERADKEAIPWRVEPMPGMGGRFGRPAAPGSTTSSVWTSRTLRTTPTGAGHIRRKLARIRQSGACR